MLPNAPYVFTRCSGLNDVFITCPGDSMFSVGAMLSSATSDRERVDRASAAPTGIGCSVGHRDRQPRQQPVVERRNASTIVSQFSHDRLPLDDQHELKHDRDQAGDPGERLRQEVAERHDQFDEVIERDAAVQDRPRQPVKVPAERVRHRLRLEVVVEARQIAPARIAAQLDQPGAEHQAEQRPPVDPVQQASAAASSPRRRRS